LGALRALDDFGVLATCSTSGQGGQSCRERHIGDFTQCVHAFVCCVFPRGLWGLWGLLGHGDRFWGSHGKYPIVLVYTPPHGHMNTRAHVHSIIRFSSEIYMCARTRALAHTCVRMYARKHVYVCPLKKTHTHAPDGLQVDSSGLFQRLRRQFFTKLNPKPEPPKPISQNSKPQNPNTGFCSVSRSTYSQNLKIIQERHIGVFLCSNHLALHLAQQTRS